MLEMGGKGQGWRVGCVAGMVCLLVCLSPSWAQAMETEPDLSDLFGSFGRAPMEFEARASNGYSVRVEGTGRHVILSASGPAGTANYVVKGSVSRNRITANFGRRGRVDVQFRASRRKKIETAPNRCKGRPHVTRWGVFVGTIRFVGERGYTKLRRGRAPGRVNVTPRWKCKEPSSAGNEGAGGGDKPTRDRDKSIDPDVDVTVLEILNRPTGLEAGATVMTVGDEKLTLLVAVFEERRKRMQIARSAFELAPDDVFSVDESLSMATIGPSGPFSGTATFQRNPDGSMSGAGSFSVALPGARRISLAGPDNRVRLYRLSEDGIATPGM